MPRLNRTFVFALLLASSCAFLLFQLYYYRKYVSKDPGLHLLDPAGHVTSSQVQWDPGLHLLDPAGHVTSSQVQWQNLRRFLSLARSFRLPLFLADSASLSLLSHDALLRRGVAAATRQQRCSFLCAGRPITSFFLPAGQWRPGFLPAAEQKGFRLLEVRGRDPRLSGLDSLSGEEIPLHFLFRLHGYVIQVVVLYERSGGFLWHGALRLPAAADATFAPFGLLDYGRHAGAYDRPELVLTALDGLDVRVPRNASHFLQRRRDARFLECRYHDARSFLQRHPDDASPAALDFQSKAKRLLRLAAQTLDRLGVRFWISSGTVLGWYRQCGVISYSRDVDIGIFVSDFRPQITAELQQAGMRLKHRFGKVEDSLELSFLLEDVKLDVFFFYRDGDVVWNGGTQARSGRKFKYVFPSFSLCWAELLEVKVRVPCETLDYVTANYGAAWSVPVRRWDWKTSPSNVVENGAWPVAEWAELIQVY